MNNNTEEKSFVTLSREIADNFIRDVVFIDEQAYGKLSDKTQNIHNHEFNAREVSDSFLKKGKICAIYAPQSDVDIQECVASLLKADVVVLDWDLNIEDTSIYDPMADDVSEKRSRAEGPPCRRLRSSPDRRTRNPDHSENPSSRCNTRL